MRCHEPLQTLALLAGLLTTPDSPVQASQVASDLTSATRPAVPDWFTAWSALVPIAEHPRTLPSAPGLPDLLLADSARTGLFWTEGNPAALAFEVDRRWNALNVRGASEDGRFRRPMDPVDASALGFLGLGWQPIGTAAAVGRILVDQETLGRVPFADFIQPYTTNPHFVADSSFPEMRHVRARLDGAFGARFGDWGLGISGGVEILDRRTRDARLPRIGRRALQGVTVGVARRLPWAGLQVAAKARWRGGDESFTLLAQPGQGTAYRFFGYGEPIVGRVAPPAGFFFRRMERDAWLWGGSASGRALGTRWTVGWESTHHDEAHFSEQQADPPKDRWGADGSTIRLSVQRGFWEERILTTGRLIYSSLDGEGTRSDLEGAVFRAHETVLFASGDFRYVPHGSPWMGALEVSLLHESRERRDFIAEVRSEIEEWRPGLAVELARALGSATRVSIGYAITFHSSVSEIPDPGILGPLYGLILAPELSLYATQSRPMRFGLGAEQQLGGGSTLLLRAQRSWASPHDPDPNLPFVPSGDRSMWEASLAVVLSG